MLYPRNAGHEPDPELFRNPTSEYRGAPFWAWNNDLKDDLLRREIGVMQEMGMGGFHMHTRCGMSVPYLSDAYMQKVRLCVEEARKRHMLAWLYDEDKWPSGFAGGYVTKKEENRQRYLLLSPRKPAAGKLLRRYEVCLDTQGCLSSYRTLPGDEQGSGQVWYASEQVTAPRPWFHFNGYADTMNPSAIRDFIHLTHDRYLEVLGKDIGTLCPAIFTDEPQLPRKTVLSSSADLQDIILPWTPDLEDSYLSAYGESLLEKLPEVIWELPQGVSLTRYRFHDHTTERFVSAFCDQIGNWCRSHGILMTGHMMNEGSLEGQTQSIGEAMRAYRAFTLPGVDQLCDGREFITVKQAASAAHQQGCPGVTSEMYGVTNWDFDFKGHKLQGDWQAALGVSVRVHHLYWCSMHGESKRDYPASIGHQSPWWKEYPFIENHFARVNTMMTRGRPLIRIGVIHPIESYWISFGPNDLTGLKRREMDRRFAELTEWLLLDTLDFDYLCESTLPQLHTPGESFRVGEMAYDAVIVPGCETLRRTTLDALRVFQEAGGRVLFLGEIPQYVDAVRSQDADIFSMRCERLPWDRDCLNRSLLSLREVRILDEHGRPADTLLCSMRQDGDHRNVFIAHHRPAVHGAPERREHYDLEFRGCWKVSVYDSLTGDIYPMDAELLPDRTRFSWDCYAQDSLLVRLSPASPSSAQALVRSHAAQGTYGIRMREDLTPSLSPAADTLLPPPDMILPAEENVLVLDRASWRTDSGPWQPAEDMLRIGIAAKKMLGLSTAAVSGAQPWILGAEKAEHTLSLRLSFSSDLFLPSVRLALEDADQSEVWFNGKRLAIAPDGCFTDESIVCIPAGPVLAGLNTLEITRPLCTSSSVENVFLLGAFGVFVRGPEAKLTAPPTSLAYGDWTTQGFPFYSGVMTYRYHLEGGRSLRLRLGRFSAPCVTAELDGKRIGNLSLAPSEADLGFLPPGPHTLDITVYPSRINSFGTLHLNDRTVIWYGPDAWRTTGMRWTQNYMLTPCGLLSEPHLLENPED